MKKAMSVLFFLLSGCGYVNYAELPAGRFDGTLFVMWVGEGNDLAGDGRFVFVPMPRDPLVFSRKNPDATVTRIEPQIMYTDGGSIPRLAQPLRGLSPWGYAPGYMVHDWLFVAKHCNTDGMANTAEKQIAAMPFVESAEILGEAIKTLIAEKKVQPDDVAPFAISTAVAGPVARALWEREGACRTPRISPEHQRQIDNALGRFTRTLAGRERLFGTPPTRDTAGIVSVIRF